MQQTNIKKENKSNYQFIVFQEPGLELGGLTIFKDKSNKYAFIEFNNNEEDSVVMYLEKIQKFIDKRAIDAIQYYPDSYLVSGLYIMKCPHNGLFEGEVRNGKPFSGKGCIKHNNGSFSIGQWQDGDLTGKVESTKEEFRSQTGFELRINTRIRISAIPPPIKLQLLTSGELAEMTA